MTTTWLAVAFLLYLVKRASTEPGVNVGSFRDGLRPPREIYNAYWWPLKPPPYHHPGVDPRPHELKAMQALEENYTSYWRSLPRYPEVSWLVTQAQKVPYFKGPWQSTVAPSLPAEGEGKLVFVCHHKTGVNLHNGMSQALKRVFKTQESFFEPAPAILGLGAKAKVVHLARDPVGMVLSGYRYHQFRWGAETWSWGHGRPDQDPHCFQCDSEDHDIIFDTCKFNCTYFELLNRVDEITGVVLEAVSARATITSMAQGLAAWAKKDNVLQISMDLLSGNPKQTTACIMKFLGVGKDAELAERFQTEALNVTDSDHVTRGLFNNTHLKEFLETSPWSKDFNEVRKLMAKIYERQATMYGCPVTPL